MRRTLILITATAALGAVTVPPAGAEPPHTESTTSPAINGSGPYDMVRKALSVFTAARASLLPGPSAPRVRDLVFPIEYLEKRDTIALSNRGMTYGLQSTLLFGKDSSELVPGAEKEIGKFGKKIAAAKSVRVTGYTDNLGSAAHGLTLSRERAAVIKKVLQKAAPGVTFQARGLGEKDPVADNSTEEGRIKNRRVEIDVEIDRDPLPGADQGDSS
ncbi:OmpA family protein [Streptomyces niveus]|uniref:OmpA family protein n=1 Tax=Streptomyces niveus TaxID=193462 RepID=UPI0036B4804C